MEIGPVTRPGPSALGPITRIAPTASLAPVKAQLPSVAVDQIPDAPEVGANAKRAPSDPDTVDRQVRIDPATQQVIYQAIDKASGEVVRQVPDELLLRLRVYARAMRHADSRKSDVSLSA